MFQWSFVLRFCCCMNLIAASWAEEGLVSCIMYCQTSVLGLGKPKVQVEHFPFWGLPYFCCSFFIIFRLKPKKSAKREKETRLGLHFQTPSYPLSFDPWPLSLIPYPLSLPLVFGLRLGVRQKHIDSRKIGSRKKMGKNKSCIQKKFWAQNNCGTEKGKRYFVQKKLVQK